MDNKFIVKNAIIGGILGLIISRIILCTSCESYPYFTEPITQDTADIYCKFIPPSNIIILEGKVEMNYGDVTITKDLSGLNIVMSEDGSSFKKSYDCEFLDIDVITENAIFSVHLKLPVAIGLIGQEKMNFHSNYIFKINEGINNISLEY